MVRVPCESTFQRSFSPHLPEVFRGVLQESLALISACAAESVIYSLYGKTLFAGKYIPIGFLSFCDGNIFGGKIIVGRTCRRLLISRLYWIGEIGCLRGGWCGRILRFCIFCGNTNCTASRKVRTMDSTFFIMCTPFRLFLKIIP